MCYPKGISTQEFFSLLPIENASTIGYFNALQKQLEILSSSELLSGDCLVGTRTDGASSMIEQNGLVAKLSKMDGLTHLVGIHCTAHRLKLTVLSSMKRKIP